MTVGINVRNENTDDINKCTKEIMDDIIIDVLADDNDECVENILNNNNIKTGEIADEAENVSDLYFDCDTYDEKCNDNLWDNSNNVENIDKQIDVACNVRGMEVTGSHLLDDDVRSIEHKLRGLSTEGAARFINLLRKYKNLFSEKFEGTTVYTHKLKVVNHRPFVKRFYPVPLVLRKSVKEKIKRMLDAGIKERWESQYCNPLRVVKKKDGRVRVSLDARSLNSIIESDNETPPLIQEIIQHFHGVELMSCVDLAHGYWQIPLDRESRRFYSEQHCINFIVCRSG